MSELIEMDEQTASFNLGAPKWDVFKEDYDIEDELEWLENENPLNVTFETLKTYLKEDNMCSDLTDNFSDFCDENLFDKILQAKEFLGICDERQLTRAKRRANPFETINSVFFMNRAAIKMANIDASTNFMFSNIDGDINHLDEKGLVYFADVCAGPGGFSEYIFWRRSWFFKGFGLTLKNDIDFKLSDSCCTSPHSFQAFYGSEGDGNICNPNNIEDFKQKVMCQTRGKGVHFMTSDGGFSVEGKEKFQEILSRNIYLCQCLVALEILRTHGNFVTKLFDVFTRFSVGLVFMMYKCFKKVCIIKPKSSRPANSERYLICYDRQDNQGVESIKQYLRFVSKEIFENYNNDCKYNLELIPIEMLRSDIDFIEFMKKSSNKIGERQINSLNKLHAFYKNPTLQEMRQSELHTECLEYWQIPNRTKNDYSEINLENDKYLNNFALTEDWMKVPPKIIVDESVIENFGETRNDWSFCALCSTTTNSCDFYAGFSNKTCRWQDGRWVKVKKLKFTPGTFLYGEMVKEIIKNEDDIVSFKCSFHIIDAVYLGSTCLMNLSFRERMKLIEMFAESINQEFQEKNIRIRKKPTMTLSAVMLSKIIKNKDGFQTILPTIGCYNVVSEYHEVYSVLFLKQREDHTPQSTFVLRNQLDLIELKGYSLFDKLRDVLFKRDSFD